MTRSDILQAATACVTQDRNRTYGPPEDSFAVIGQYWSTYLGVPVGAAQVGTLLALMKIARIQSNPAHADSYVDGAGYLACAGGIATEINKPSPMEKLRKVALPTLATNSDEWHARNAANAERETNMWVRMADASRTHQTAPDPERGGWRDIASCDVEDSTSALLRAVQEAETTMNEVREAICADEEPLNQPK